MFQLADLVRDQNSGRIQIAQTLRRTKIWILCMFTESKHSNGQYVSVDKTKGYNPRTLVIILQKSLRMIVQKQICQQLTQEFDFDRGYKPKRSLSLPHFFRICTS